MSDNSNNFWWKLKPWKQKLQIIFYWSYFWCDLPDLIKLYNGIKCSVNMFNFYNVQNVTNLLGTIMNTSYFYFPKYQIVYDFFIAKKEEIKIYPMLTVWKMIVMSLMIVVLQPRQWLNCKYDCINFLWASILFPNIIALQVDLIVIIVVGFLAAI